MKILPWRLSIRLENRLVVALRRRSSAEGSSAVTSAMEGEEGEGLVLLRDFLQLSSTKSRVWNWARILHWRQV